MERSLAGFAPALKAFKETFGADALPRLRAAHASAPALVAAALEEPHLAAQALWALLALADASPQLAAALARAGVDAAAPALKSLRAEGAGLPRAELLRCAQTFEAAHKRAAAAAASSGSK